MNSAFVLTLAYPDTIVKHAEEWYSSFLKYLGIGNKTHVRAGHAAMVLISKASGELEYHDFGRYITSEPNGRVRGKITDCELQFPIKAEIKNDTIKNLDDILEFLGTHPKLTHGEGKLVASVCNAVNYDDTKRHIESMQKKELMYYAAFKKDSCNCARFVTGALIAGVTDETIKKKLIKSKWFTPSTVGNVLLANTERQVFEVSEKGEIQEFKGSQSSENLRCFLDRLKGFSTDYVGTLKPKHNSEKKKHAQWLSGIAAGAWFELYETGKPSEFRFRRISPYGNVDVNAQYKCLQEGFAIDKAYKFVHYSNCAFFNIEQNDKVFRFERID